MFFFFFFQAEDGIRDKLVTGVQTCALPISHHRTLWPGCVRSQVSAGGASSSAPSCAAETLGRLGRSEEHTSELQSLAYLVCRLLLEKKKKNKDYNLSLCLT